jgi:hypothetical protein
VSEQPAATEMNGYADRLENTATGIAALRPAVETREPWPLSSAYGSEPESDWGPKEVLAHTAEMLAYWPAEIDRILAGDPEPVAFGRVSTDPARIERIGRDRNLPAAELFDLVAERVGAFSRRIRSLTPTETGRRGLHPRLGEMTVAAIVPRFLVTHLEEHVEQLRAILAR